MTLNDLLEEMERILSADRDELDRTSAYRAGFYDATMAWQRRLEEVIDDA